LPGYQHHIFSNKKKKKNTVALMLETKDDVKYKLTLYSRKSIFGCLLRRVYACACQYHLIPRGLKRDKGGVETQVCSWSDQVARWR